MSYRSGLTRSSTYSGLNYPSQVESALITAKHPIEFPNSRDYVQAAGYRGVQLNKNEEEEFRGPQPLSSYQINEDPTPDLIRKPSAPVKYTQEIAVRHLNPPQPAPHGDLIIKEYQNQIPPAPPVVVRQEGLPAIQPATQVYREAPPPPPPRLPTQIIEVEGAPVPPPARKVVFEKLPDQPAKPANILIEKWLPYKPRSRRVIYQRSCVPPPPNPKNLVIEWDQPCVHVDQVCVNLGVCDADPEEYIRKYGCELKQPCEIPNLCPSHHCVTTTTTTTTVQPPQPCSNLVRSASVTTLHHVSGPSDFHLEGDLHALRLVDLDKYGLGEYRRFL